MTVVRLPMMMFARSGVLSVNDGENVTQKTPYMHGYLYLPTPMPPHIIPPSVPLTSSLLYFPFFFSLSLFGAFSAVSLSSHFSQPAWHRSSSMTRSLILNHLAGGRSMAQASQPLWRTTLVMTNHPTALTAPAADPANTCLVVW